MKLIRPQGRDHENKRGGAGLRLRAASFWKMMCAGECPYALITPQTGCDIKSTRFVWFSTPENRHFFVNFAIANQIGNQCGPGPVGKRRRAAAKA